MTRSTVLASRSADGRQIVRQPGGQVLECTHSRAPPRLLLRQNVVDTHLDWINTQRPSIAVSSIAA